MDLILDTNAVSALAEGDSGAVGLFSQADTISLPVIVLGEFRFGISRSRASREYAKWLLDLVACCEVMEIRDSTASLYAEIRLELKKAGTPIPSNDIWIAALCREHRCTLLSQDRHFDAVQGLVRLGWEE